MAHAQKPDFVFRRKVRVHLNLRGASVQSTTGSRGVRISGSNAGYTMFRGCVKSTGYPLHSPVSPSLPLPCITVCHHIATGLYCRHHDVSPFKRQHPFESTDLKPSYNNEPFVQQWTYPLPWSGKQADNQWWTYTMQAASSSYYGGRNILH
jgi:hypothetical protein